jgi:hypothetical protein
MSFLPDGTLDHLRQLSDAPERYRVEREIGRGGMGVVYEAWDSQLDRRVALKVIDFGPVEEARIAAQLEHPGLIPVYDSGTLPDGRAYYAMRLVRGRRLDEFIGQDHGLGERLRVLVKVCDAVAFAHDRGVIHCDLKPQNIMIGGFGEVFVMDWGLARRVQHEGPGARTGTPPYLAPEHPPDHRADIFSLGRILLDLTGGGVVCPLAAVATRAMAANPSERYQNVQDLAADLVRFLDGMPVTAHVENSWERTVRYVRRNQVLLLLIAAFLVVKLALFFFRRP